MVIELGLSGFAAVILAGGQASRLGGVDKATIELGGRSLLERTLDAVVDAGEVVVVGQQVPTERPVTFVLETERLDAVRPDREAQHGLSIRALLEPLDLVDVASIGSEARDIDTWSDLRDLASEAEGR